MQSTIWCQNYGTLSDYITLTFYIAKLWLVYSEADREGLCGCGGCGSLSQCRTWRWSGCWYIFIHYIKNRILGSVKHGLFDIYDRRKVGDA